MPPTKSVVLVSKFSVDLWKRFGEAVVPSDSKKGNNSLIIRCGPQTVTRAFLCCCDWDEAVQAARTGSVCVKPEGQGLPGTGLTLGSQESSTTPTQKPCHGAGGCCYGMPFLSIQAGQGEVGMVTAQQSGNGKMKSQVSSQSRRAKQQFVSSREWVRTLHSVS